MQNIRFIDLDGGDRSNRGGDRGHRRGAQNIRFTDLEGGDRGERRGFDLRIHNREADVTEGGVKDRSNRIG